jgi:heterodisulfide reductase subunit A
MACARAVLLEPLPPISIPMTQKGLVMGAGVSGMNAALALANQGFEVYLVEQGKDLGGNARSTKATLGGMPVTEYLNALISKVESHPRIHIYKNSRIESVAGYIGNFKSRIREGARSSEIEHGIIIVATGAREYRPKEYLFGDDDRVVTQRELEKVLYEVASSDLSIALEAGKQVARDENTGNNSDDTVSSIEYPASSIKKLSSVVMIQCVGSRDEEHPYCSRVCCANAVKNAIALKKKSPGTEVVVLYRDIRTYGLNEVYYQEARDLGVVFVRFDEKAKPEIIKEDSQLKVKVHEPVLDEDVAFPADLIVLSAGIVPNGSNKETAQLLKVPLNEDGFFLEAHMKLRPVDFATDGIFVCGLAHSPKSIDESITQALAAADRAGIMLSREAIDVLPAVASIDESKCIGCGICETLCAYKAHFLKKTDKGYRSEIIVASCKGCGSCAASCPQQAITMMHFKNEQIDAAIEALVK